MQTLSRALIAAGAFAVLTFVTGIALRRAGTPFGVGSTTVHKLIAVASVVSLALAFRHLARAGASTGLAVALAVIAVAAFLALIATGALLTRPELELPGIVTGIHRTAPYIAYAMSAATLGLMAATAS